MNYIIGDIGNTNIKICKINKNFKIVKTYLFDTKSKNFDKILNKNLNNIIQKDTNKNALFSSVVPNVYNKIKKILIKNKMKVFEVKKFNLKKLINFKIKKYSQLGSDRIANSIGAFYKFKSNCVIIDFGTATTFDVIKKNGVYDGGVIAPGINLSIKTLNQFTALLPILKLKKTDKPYGKNTKDALNAGFLWGYQGLINNIIRKIILSSNKNYKIILTGGYAKLFKKYINKKSIIDENITIKGIMKIHKDLLK